jgi:hypothetical protein
MFIFLKVFDQEHKFETQAWNTFIFPWEIILQGTFYDNLFDFKIKKLNKYNLVMNFQNLRTWLWNRPLKLGNQIYNNFHFFYQKALDHILWHANR